MAQRILSGLKFHFLTPNSTFLNQYVSRLHSVSYCTTAKYRGTPWLPMPVFLPGEFYGQRSLVGYIPQGHKEWDTTEATEHSTPVRL